MSQFHRQIFTEFDADSMCSYPPGAAVTLVVYGTTASSMNIYPIVLYATEDSMWQFHRQIFTEFDADPMGSYPPGAVVTLVVYGTTASLYEYIPHCTLCY